MAHRNAPKRVPTYLKGTQTHRGTFQLRVALTDRFVATAKAVGSQVDYFDAKVPGLSLRVSQRGARAWCFSFTGTDQRRNRITLGTYPAMPLASARAGALDPVIWVAGEGLEDLRPLYEA